MSTPVKYSYTVLRYVHDVVTGEFVNVGVALYAPDRAFLNAICRTTYRRISATFPGLKGEHFRAVMRHVQGQFEQLGEKLASDAIVSAGNSLQEIVRSVLPVDDSALQWSPVGVGVATDPSQVLESLFNRMVMRYDEPQANRHRKTDEDVWRGFKRDLEQRRLLRYFEPKTIAVQGDEIRFEHAWKNGVWHCIEPVSLDLSSPESIKEKAHRLLGHITSVNQAAEDFRLYMLVAKPVDPALAPAYESAMSILGRMPCEKEIFREEAQEKLADRLEREVEAHLQQQRIQS